MDTVEIDGRRFLLCDRENCQWNLRYVSGDERRRLCNFGLLAYGVKESLPHDCPHLQELGTVISRELLEQSIRGMADTSGQRPPRE